MAKGDVVKKCIPSLILFIAGFFITLLVFQKPVSTSFLAGWFVGGFIYGRSLTKKWFPKFDPFYGTDSHDSVEHFKGAFFALGFSFCLVLSFIVGIVAMPIGIVILIVSSVKAGTDAVKKTSSSDDVQEVQTE